MKIAIYQLPIELTSQDVVEEKLTSIPDAFSADVLLAPTEYFETFLKEPFDSVDYIAFVDEEFNAENAHKIIGYNYGYFTFDSVQKQDWQEWIKVKSIELERFKHFHSYRQIVNSLVDPILVFSSEFKMVDGNPAAYRFFGDDVKNTSLKELVPHQYQDLEKTLLSQNSILGEEVSITWNGKTIPFICSIWSEFEANNSVKYFALLHDLTNRLSLEKEMKRAENMSMISRLTRSIGHEVRNPLNNVTLALDALKDELNNQSDAALYLEIIQRNANRINELINELLESSKPAALQLEEVSVRNVINGVINKAGDRFRLKQVRLIQQFEGANISIHADSNKLEIALLNLIINAVEAVESETGRIILSCKEQDNHAVFEITDNGIGMEEEELKILFDPFYTKKKGGVGLGLTTTQNIVNAHRGFIDVSSRVNEGTTFQVKIPIRNLSS